MDEGDATADEDNKGSGARQVARTAPATAGDNGGYRLTHRGCDRNTTERRGRSVGGLARRDSQ